MIKNILAVGDSFTYGEELDNRNNAWPIVLANKLGATVTNLGKPGSGNKRMIRYIMEHIANNDTADLVIIGWSSPCRIEFADSSGIFDTWPGYNGNMFIKEHPWRLGLLDYINRYHNDNYLYKQDLLDVVLLQSFLRDNNIKYIMVKTVGNEFYHHNQFASCEAIGKLINSTYYLGWPNEGMSEWVGDALKGPGGHFLDEGHRIVADKLYEHIKKLGWV